MNASRPGATSVTRAAAWLVVVVLLLAAPFFFGVLGLQAVGDAAVLTVVIMSSNLLTGITGQISIGQSAFYGTGAYITAILVQNAGWSFWAALPMAVLGGAIIGVVAGIPALRIAGLHLALVTLGLALVFPTVITGLGAVAGGPSGLTVSQGIPVPSWFPFTNYVWVYWILIVLMLAVLLLSRNLIRSRTGRAMFAIRDQPLLAASLGINVRVSKVVVFSGTAALAGLAGWMFVAQNQFVSSDDFDVVLSINILLATVIGGSGTVAGPLIGALFLRFIPDWTEDVGVPSILSPAITGVLIILVLLFMPNGVAGLGRSLFRRIAARRGRRAQIPARGASRPSRSPRRES